MSADFPTLAEIGEENIRAMIQRINYTVIGSSLMSLQCHDKEGDTKPD